MIKEAHDKALAEAKAAIEELEREKKQAHKVAAAGGKTGLPLLFEDSIGRKFSCPWHTCNLWKVNTLKSVASIVLIDRSRVWRSS